MASWDQETERSVFSQFALASPFYSELTKRLRSTALSVNITVCPPRDFHLSPLQDLSWSTQCNSPPTPGLWALLGFQFIAFHSDFCCFSLTCKGYVACSCKESAILCLKKGLYISKEPMKMVYFLKLLAWPCWVYSLHSCCIELIFILLWQRTCGFIAKERWPLPSHVVCLTIIDIS